MLVMMVVVGIEIVDAAAVVVEAERAVVVVVVSEVKNSDEEGKSTMSHDKSCDVVDFLSSSKFNFASLTTTTTS